jgi:hypothetical protein
MPRKQALLIPNSSDVFPMTANDPRHELFARCGALADERRVSPATKAVERGRETPLGP